MAAALAFVSLSACGQPSLDAGPAVPLRHARLPAVIKQTLAGVILSELALGDSDVASRKQIAYASQVRFVSLHTGAAPAILLEPSDRAGLCAPNGNGNCPLWLFVRRGMHAVLVLATDGEDLSVQKTSHAGMLDLVSTYRIGHTPVTEDMIDLHFDGTRYRSVRCTESTSGGDEDGASIAPHPCPTNDE